MTKEKMDEPEKPFNEVWIVLLVIVALANDGLEVLFDLLAMTGIGLPGEAIMEPINIALGPFFTAVFWIKCGFGAPAIVQLIASLLEVVGLPTRTISVLGAIWVANHPSSKISQTAKLAAAVESGGASGELAEAEGVAEEAEEIGEVAEAGTAAGGAAEEAAAAESEAVQVEGASTEGGAEQPQAGEAEKEAGGGNEAEAERIEAQEERKEAVRPGGESAEGAEGKEEGKEEDISATEAEEDPEDFARRKLLEEAPDEQNQEEKEDENEEDGDDSDGSDEQQESNVVDIGTAKKEQKAKEVKQRQKQITKPGEITAKDDEDTLKMPKAA